MESDQYQMKQSMNNIRLLIADDHQMFRTAIVAILVKEEGIRVVGEADNGGTAMQLDEKHQPDVILMDIGLPEVDGFEATRQILANRKGAKVLALTSSEDVESVLKMIRAGAKGYVLKDAPVEELVLAIRTIANGSSYFAKEVSSKLLNLLRHTNIPFIAKKAAERFSLTEREAEILRHIAEEMTNKEIAAKLFISPRTVETHRRNLINKLKVKNTAGLVKYYLNFMHDRNSGTLAGSGP